MVAGLALGLTLPRGSGARTAGARIEKDLAAADDEIAGLSAKLENAAYLEKAPAAVVEKTRRRLRELEEKRAALAVSRVVIDFAGGMLEPGRWRTLENCVCLALDPVLQRPGARDRSRSTSTRAWTCAPTVLVAEAQPGAYGRNARPWAAPAGRRGCISR